MSESFKTPYNFSFAYGGNDESKSTPEHFEAFQANVTHGGFARWSDVPTIVCWSCDAAFTLDSLGGWTDELVGYSRECPHCHARCTLKIRRAKAKRWMWVPAEGESL